MDANQLFFWLRGFAEIVPSGPTDHQWAVIRDELLRATPVNVFPTERVPVIIPETPSTAPKHDCGCKSKRQNPSHGDS